MLAVMPENCVTGLERDSVGLGLDVILLSKALSIALFFRCTAEVDRVSETSDSSIFFRFVIRCIFYYASVCLQVKGSGTLPFVS